MEHVTCLLWLQFNIRNVNINLHVSIGDILPPYIFHLQQTRCRQTTDAARPLTWTFILKSGSELLLDARLTFPGSAAVIDRRTDSQVTHRGSRRR